ncbi:hypothetical protein GOV04_02205 [Candidatus Woesearchaeota archaeon]|nr:hypothetical protein [Candidatus Woesearchaeota archaeon]
MCRGTIKESPYTGYKTPFTLGVFCSAGLFSFSIMAMAISTAKPLPTFTAFFWLTECYILGLIITITLYIFFLKLEQKNNASSL